MLSRAPSPGPSASPAPALRRSIVIPSAGGYNRLVLETGPIPAPGPGEVRIDVRAIGVNFADTIVRMGLYASAKEFVGWPITPGFEGSPRSARCATV